MIPVTRSPAPTLILIAGLPGAGKTALAGRLEQEIPAIRLCGDEWMVDLGFNMHDEAARDRIEVLFWKIAQRLLQVGVSVILESGFWLRSDRDQKRLGARSLGVAVELRYLDVPLEERWRRIAARNEDPMWSAHSITRGQLEDWDQYFEVPDEAELALFDKAEIARWPNP